MWHSLRHALAAAALAFLTMHGALAAEPIKVGFALGLTGANAPNGKQLLVALQIWRDDVNAKGGLLGRKVELVYYDDQTQPANDPAIYTKLVDVDHVDLLLGPYGTNLMAAAMPLIIQHKLTTISMLATAVNRQYHYNQYFSMVPLGPDPVHAFSSGFFDIAASLKPKVKTVALLGIDAEFGKNSVDGARDNAKKAGLTIVYDKLYPPPTTDFTPILRAVQATNPDIIFVASYPPDTVGIVHAAREIGLKTKIFGGTMIGLLATPLKVQMGPLMNGILFHEDFVPAFNFPGSRDLLKRYQAIAKQQGGIDPLGYGFVPFGYAAGQVLAQAVDGTKSLDHQKLAQYMHSHSFSTVVGEVRFNADGEWAKPRYVFSQWQHLTGNDIGQLEDPKHDVVVWPAEYKTGNLIFPYTDALK
ncbi:MAG TPA: amino acid ABC transporter substrate-binding protein [Stellaceae bacterium]|jgi:branched-chain amino acid transport system substrate-binding protein|nr:amino acid ABC transporter substrate-binding protein [Stellaceae bacterium]